MAYADDGYIKAKLGVALEVLSDMKHVFKEDAGLDLNFDKAKILGRRISVADAHAAAQRMLAAYSSLAHLSLLLSSASLVVDGYIAFAVPIGTDAFIQHFVDDKCQAIVEDVDKLDNIKDSFITLPADPLLPGYPPSIFERPCAAREPKRPPAATRRPQDGQCPSLKKAPETPTKHGTNQHDRAWPTCACTSPTKRAVSESPTTPSAGTRRRCIRPT